MHIFSHSQLSFPVSIFKLARKQSVNSISIRQKHYNKCADIYSKLGSYIESHIPGLFLCAYRRGSSRMFYRYIYAIKLQMSRVYFVTVLNGFVVELYIDGIVCKTSLVTYETISPCRVMTTEICNAPLR